MAKIYKVSVFITDYNDDYQNVDHFQSELQERLEETLWAGVDHLEVQESDEFEWDDDLEVNKTTATKEAFEEYFKK